MRFCSTRLAARCRRSALALVGVHFLTLLSAACSSDRFRAGGLGGQSGSSEVAAAAGEAPVEGLGGSPGQGSAGEAPEVSGESGAPSEAQGGAPSEAQGGAPSLGGGTGGVAGTAGKAALSCDCAAGSYCQDATSKCRQCSDFSRLEFGPAQKLTTLAHAPGSIERFPRSAQKTSALFYSSGASAAQGQLWYSATPVSGIGSALSEPELQESGPLFAPGLIEEKNFFFDRYDAATQRRKIMTGTWSGTMLSNVEPASMQLNGIASSDYSVAIAAAVGHVYWMSTRGGRPELLYGTTALGLELPARALDLELKVGPTVTCPRTGDDATPWVSLDGKLLLFRNQSLDENCEPNDSGAYDLFAVPLAKDGAAAGSALPLSGLNYTGGESSETDPSLSPDACSIYFASDNDNRDFDLYRAFRK